MTERNHTRRTRDGRVQLRRAIVWGLVAVPLFAFALLGTNTMNGLMFIVMSGLALAVFSLPANRIAGYRAEESVVSQLAKMLPDDYVLFNQVEVPNQRSRTGTTEIDVLVIGPTGVHILEVKDNAGEIMCRNDRSASWRVKKVGRRGGVYYDTMRNPARQAMSQALTLKDFLRGHDIDVWISPAIVATNRRSRWRNADTLDVPVIDGTRKNLARTITMANAKQDWDRSKVAKVEQILLDLIDDVTPADELAPANKKPPVA